jgi:hypothetical protein
MVVAPARKKTWFSYARSMSLALIALSFSFIASGCFKSPPPTITELLQVSPPIFDYTHGNGFMLTSSRLTELTGRCDRNSYGLEFSLNGGQSWAAVTGACPTGRFAFKIQVPKSAEVFIRAKSKFSVTEASFIKVRYVIPPTSPTLSLVSSASSDDDEYEPKAASIISSTFSGTPMNSASYRVQIHVPGIVYAQE